MEQVIAYVRYSSHAQDDGNSVAAQITCIDEYARLHNMEIENYYIDTAKSGRNTNRSYYKQMIEDISTGRTKARTILVRAIDRLHRNAKNTLVDTDFFEKHHIRLIGITDGIDTADKNYSKFALTIKAAAAEDYSNLLSKNTRAALLESAKDCKHLGGTPPIGYSVTPEGYYEIDETKAPIVRDIYRYYLSGMGYDDILTHLKQRGYKTSNGNDFSKSAISAILTNPKYMGTYTYDRTMPKDSDGKRNSHATKDQYVEIPNGMPAIISAEDFNKVQEKKKQNSTKHTSRTGKQYYPLNGKIFCSKCGKPFSGNINNSNGRKYYQYRRSCKCKIKSVRLEQLNRSVFYAIQQCIFSPENKDAIMQKVNAKLAVRKSLQTEEIVKLTNRINGLENAQNRLISCLEEGKASKTILDKMQKNETELSALNKQLEAKSKQISTIDDAIYDKLVKQFVNYMNDVKSPEAFALKDAAIKKIDINEAGVTIHFHSGLTANADTIDYFNC